MGKFLLDTQMIFKIKLFLTKFTGWGNQQIARFWESNSGEWKWLSEKAIPLAGMNRSLWKTAVPSKTFYILLFMSGAIATFGLLADSAATIIGAMIIAPLMGPIISIAFAMVVGNRRLLKRSSLTLITGVILTIIVSIAICQIVGLRTFGAEITARVRPSLIDLGVALAAGAAGAFAKSRRHIADALPGVAIAVALVPPLSVVGIGLALGSLDASLGALLLFLANAAGIIFSGGLVFLAQRYGSLERAGKGLAVSVLTLIILALPLSFSLQRLLVRERARSTIYYLIQRQTLTFSETDIQNIGVEQEKNFLIVNLEVAAPLNSISQTQVKLVKQFLEEKLGKPINFKVRVIPINEFEVPIDSKKPDN